MVCATGLECKGYRKVGVTMSDGRREAMSRTWYPKMDAQAALGYVMQVAQRAQGR